jgi:acyl-CoA synthetase (AMP-forming)/AMP-acid ligase II/acyl carrier protein
MSVSSIKSLLYSLANQYQDKPALHSLQSTTTSYQQLFDLVDHQGQILSNSGIKPDTRVAVILPQGPMMATVCLTMMSTAVCVPLNPAFTPAELEYYFESSGVDALIALESFSPAACKLAQSKGITLIRVVELNEYSGQFEFTLDEPVTLTEPIFNNSKSTALVLHTSGSTSRPKTVPLSEQNLLKSINNLVESLALDENDQCINMMPLFHIGALLDLILAPLSKGGSIILCPDMTNDSFIKAMEQYHPSWFQSVPTFFSSLTNDERVNQDWLSELSSIRFIRSVSSALPNRLFHELETLFDCPLIEIYGMTETSGVITSNPLPPGMRKQGSVGIPAGNKVKILNSNGKPVKTLEHGQVFVSGRNVMSGYENLPANHNFHQGWFATGDEGYLDQQGYLFLVGRIKDIINRGGEKISPLEIDRIAEQYPAVDQAAAFAFQHPSLGEEIAIALVIKKGQEFIDHDFFSFLTGQLADYKIPKKLYRVKKLPRTAGGKLKRHLLAESIDRLSSEPAVRKTAPENELEILLAHIWSELLKVKQVYREDNFFKLGGDSLKAVVFFTELENRIKKEIPVSLLYQFPDLSSLAKTLADYDPEISPPIKHNDAILLSLSNLLATWQGTRQTELSLLVGRNVDGSQAPLFWAANASSVFDSLVKELGSDLPVYAMRSLYKTEYKNDQNNRYIAQHYIHEIRAIQPRGPYQIGGFCEAGKIAFHVAKGLIRQGENVSTLIMHERFVAENYPQRLAMITCKPGLDSPLHKFYDAKKRWLQSYTGELIHYTNPLKHHRTNQYPGIKILAAQIKKELKISQTSQAENTSSMLTPVAHQYLSDHDYCAEIMVDCEESMPRNSLVKLEVSVKNNSSITWLPYSQSSLLLAARWNNLKHFPRIWLAGSSLLNETVAPGQIVNFSISVKTPSIYRKRILEIDMVNDGINWFSEKGSKSFQQIIKFSF